MRGLAKSSKSCQKITDFYSNIPPEVAEKLRNLTDTVNKLKLTETDNSKSMPTSSKRVTAPRESLDYGLYMFMLSGPIAYKNLAKNTAELPSLSKIKKYLQEQDCRIEEGKLRAEELKEYINKQKLPPYVWLSEDATKIQEGVKYNSRTDCATGYVMPFDKNGMPITDTYKLKTPNDVARFSTAPKASYVNVILAQPMDYSASPFCLLIFGTDNKYTASQIVKRWQYIEGVLKELGICVAGYSTDGDPKFLSAMRHLMGLPTNDMDWFCARKTTPVFMQDTIHIVGKMKNRLLYGKEDLILGDSTISSNHLLTMVKTQPKTLHGMTEHELTSKTDKMKFDVVQKMFQDKVISCLQEVPNSRGTIFYIKLMKTVYETIYKDMSPSQRLKQLWYLVFFCREWMGHCKENDINLDHFITTNTYACIEINAHSFVNLLRFCNANNLSHLLIPPILSSQTCESFFRHARSMSTTRSTVINFNMLEFLYKTRRIELAVDLHRRITEEGKYALEDIRNRSHEVAHSSYDIALLTEENIETVVKTAYEDASRDLKEFGIIATHTSDFLPPLQTLDVKKTKVSKSKNQKVEKQREERTLSILNDAALKHIKCDSENAKNTFEVALENGESIHIRKSKLLWAFNDKDEKLSSDRRIKFKTSSCQSRQSHYKKTKIKRLK
ncbi:Peptidase S1, PA clan [Sergentomyia squamirostris]